MAGRSRRASRSAGSPRGGRAVEVHTRSRRLRRLVLPLIVVGVVAGGAAVVWATSRPLPNPAAADPAATSSRPAVSRPALGALDAPVVIAEYADFQCPFCGVFAREVKPRIEAAYVTTGKVRFEWHDFAWMGAESRAAANAARCAADQGAFWPYHDKLYATRVAPNSGTFSRERLIAAAQELGLDVPAFSACLDADTHGAVVRADTAEAARLGMTGTPTFLINGKMLVGAQPFEVFAAEIDAALAAAGRP